MGFVVKALKGAFKAVVGIASKVIGGVFGFVISGSKKKAKSANNLNKSLDPETSRKICFGRIAVPLDLRYWEVYGPNAKLYVEVLANATHTLHAYKELYLEQQLAISATGIVQAPFIGILSRSVNRGLPGQVALAVGSGGQWNATSKFTGCAHMALHWNPDEKKLPNGIPTRYTQVCECAPLYDPRRDSTVVGGSGTHRINDQSTWDYAALDVNGQPIGRNNALQALWYILGWRIQNPSTGEWILVGGRGVDPQDINLSTFIAGANACEAAGYYTDLILSTDEDHTANEDKITCDGLIGRLIDPGGLWSYYANVDDTANIAVDLTDVDVLQGNQVSWNAFKGMSDQYNQVGGKYVNGSAITLYQAFPYPLVRDATYEANLGIKRRKPQDFEQVLDYQLAQRLARLLLNQGQYQGEHSASWNYKGLRAQAWSVVRYTSERFGWVKLFRVWRHDISTDSGVGMLLKEIHPSIWTAGTVAAALVPVTGTGYNPTQQIPLTGLAASQQTVSGPGTNPTIVDAARVTWTAPPENVRRTEVRFRVQGTTYWETVAPTMRGITDVLIFPLVRGATYEVQARHISIHEVEGEWVAIVFVAGTAGNVTYAGIIQAGTTADVSSLTDTVSGINPPRTNILTALGISLGFQNQALIATDATAKPKLDGISPNAGTTLDLIATLGAPNITGNKVVGTVDGTWNGATSRQSYRGGCLLVGRRHHLVNGYSVLGLTETAISSANPFPDFKYAFYFFENLIHIVENGSIVPPPPVPAPGAADSISCQIAYDNDEVIYRINDTVVRTVATTKNRVFFAGVAVQYINRGVQDIAFNSYATNVIAAGKNIYKFDRTTVISQANLFTPEGIALGFANQALIATDATAKTRVDEALDASGHFKSRIKSISIFGDDSETVANMRGRTSKVNTTGRIFDPTMFTEQLLLGPSNTTNLVPSYTVGGSNVTVSLPAHTRKVAGTSGPITMSFGLVTGVVAFGAYWTAYVDLTGFTGISSPSVVFTSNPDDLLVANRYQLASGKAPLADSSGGSSGSGGGYVRPFGDGQLP